MLPLRTARRINIGVVVNNSILITGGSGFLGHALVEKLFAEGCERICIYSRGEHRQFLMRQEFKNDERLRWFIGDVRDRDRLERAMQGCASVIHAAALKRIEVGAENPDELIKTNIIGSMNVVEAARRSSTVANVLLVSSDKAYEPVSPYGQSKAMAESLFLQANIADRDPRFAVVRYGNVAGSTGSLIPRWRANGQEAVITDPDATRFWMSREEAAALVVSTLQTMQGGEVEIPDLPAFRLGDLAEAMGVKARRTALGAFEKRHESMDAARCSATARRMSVDELRLRLGEVA